RRAAEPRPDSREQPRAAAAGRRQGGPVGEDRHDELLQRLRGGDQVRTQMRHGVALTLFTLFGFVAAPHAAQSPNLSTIVVLVTDQSGAVVKDAKISVVNTQTGAAREAMSGSDGSATFPALSLTGVYLVTVSKEGFGADERPDVTLRAGETA